jgi:hypothetical protein
MRILGWRVINVAHYEYSLDMTHLSKVRQIWTQLRGGICTIGLQLYLFKWDAKRAVGQSCLSKIPFNHRLEHSIIPFKYRDLHGSRAKKAKKSIPLRAKFLLTIPWRIIPLTIAICMEVRPKKVSRSEQNLT